MATFKKWHTRNGYTVANLEKIPGGLDLGIGFPDDVLVGIISTAIFPNGIWDTNTGKALDIKNMRKLEGLPEFNLIDFDPNEFTS